MGNYFSKDPIEEEPKIRIVLWGLDASGKSTILYRNILRTNKRLLPTYNLNSEKVLFNDNLIRVIEIGGGYKIYELREQYIKDDISGVIYVIDATNKNLNDYCKNDFKCFMELKQLKNIPIAIFLHKQDLDDKLSKEEIQKLYSFDQIPPRNYKLFETSSKTEEGIFEGIDWIINNQAVQPL